MQKIQRALISVYDKTSIVEFARILVDEFGIEILSTGGTGNLLEKNGIVFKKISEYTQTDEMFNGRVKTLHPKIQGGILFRRNIVNDIKDAEKYNIPSIDLIVCNLYPFKAVISKPKSTLTEALEMIDIGGPTMIRAAAKNYPDVAVISNSKDYPLIIKELRENEGAISGKTRAFLAQKVFTIMAEYNANIANYLQKINFPDKKFGDNVIKIYKKVFDVRYGENWDQDAAFYKDISADFGLQNIKQISGKEISFNNYLDIDACMQVLLELGIKDYVCSIFKHTTPNGVAMDRKSQLNAVKRAFNTDPLSAFGGIWGLNKELTVEIADFIVIQKKIFVEVLLAPAYEEGALKILKSKKNMRVLEFGDFLSKRESIYKNPEIRSVLGGVLFQDYDFGPIIKEWKVVSKRKISIDEKKALIFSYIICKYAKSNSAVFVKWDHDGIYTIGIGAGQQSRVHVVNLAHQKALEFGHDLSGSVMGTDSFFPFPDGLEAAVKAGAIAIINPGGSIRDNEVIKKADEFNCGLVFCGKRVFRH